MFFYDPKWEFLENHYMFNSLLMFVEYDLHYRTRSFLREFLVASII